MEQLNQIIGGVDGHYINDNSPDFQDFWARIVDFDKERLTFNNPTYAKASSVRNPTFRYFHRLISSTIQSCHDSDTFLSTDFHLLWSGLREVNQDASLYLSDHMENQAYIHGGQKIGIGAFVTPIANHFGVQIREPPVSTSIYLDRTML